MRKYNVIFIILVIGFVGGSKTMTPIAQDIINQTNSTMSDGQKIIVTWLETNDTKTNDTPVISVSGEDFWMVFEPLLKHSINRSAISSE